ncbi:kynureninase [uncultured Draconibacterium sp.]|uniref:kynureninase n=1 Tax=uncultured Draconibacterium sp. TaxID=1573823 RepID=UPI0025D26B4A|nr:kynureninase [uncultured Draconibacterium sp.]
MTTDQNFTLAEQLDRDDQLRNFRSRFYIESENTIYLDGNSLGRLPIKTKELLSEVVEKQWGTELIESWNLHWYQKPAQLGDKIAPIIGATKGEVIVSDSTSINLYKLAHAALKLQKGKTTIVSDDLNFPTDLYISQGLLKEFGPDYKLELAKTTDGITIETEELKSKITKNTALVVLSLVAFKSAFMYQLEEITEHAHKMGAVVLWDLSHAAGAVEIDLNKCNADLAVGCTYKYLNGGPGSPAFLYVRKDLQDKLSSPIQGWFGDALPFEFDLNYRPVEGIRRFLTGTPPVLNLMAIEPGIDMVNETGMKNIHQKSTQLSEFFLSMADSELSDYGFEVGSPTEPEKRGSHVSLKHDEAYRICQALIHPKSSTLKIIPDFRDPDNIRFGFTPLYTTFKEVWQTAQRLKEIIRDKEYEQFSTQRSEVT